MTMQELIQKAEELEIRHITILQELEVRLSEVVKRKFPVYKKYGTEYAGLFVEIRKSIKDSIQIRGHRILSSGKLHKSHCNLGYFSLEDIL